MTTVYVSVGNSDDKLPQARWHEFVLETKWAIEDLAEQIHGRWFSNSDDRYQNHCVCFDIPAGRASALRAELERLARKYGQDAITWAPAEVEFIA